MRCYSFIRMDLPIPYQLVQVGHSAYQAGVEFGIEGQIPYLILLQAKDKQHLYEIQNFLEKKNIQFHMFFEPDNNMGHSSITTEPLSLEQAKLLSSFKLYK